MQIANNTASNSRSRCASQRTIFRASSPVIILAFCDGNGPTNYGSRSRQRNKMVDNSDVQSFSLFSFDVAKVTNVTNLVSRAAVPTLQKLLNEEDTLAIV